MADPKRTRPEAEAAQGAVTNDAEEQLKAIAGLYAGGGAKPDFSSVWQDEVFINLSESEQKRLREKYAGESIEQAAIETPPGSEAAPQVQRQERTETTEGSRQRPKTWVFQNYQLKPDRKTNGFLIFEKKKRFNDETDEYETSRRPQQTAIRVSEDLAARILAGEVRPEEVIDFCENVRRHLDGPEKSGGLRLLFDRTDPDDKTPRLPIWKYYPEEIPADRRFDFNREPIDVGNEPWADKRDKIDSPDTLPPNLFKIADDYWRRNGKEYWRDQTWRDWYGRTLQIKREDIITKQLALADFGRKVAEQVFEEQEPHEPPLPPVEGAVERAPSSPPTTTETPHPRLEGEIYGVSPENRAPIIRMGRIMREQLERMAPLYGENVSGLEMRVQQSATSVMRDLQPRNAGGDAKDTAKWSGQIEFYEDLFEHQLRFWRQHPRLETIEGTDIIPISPKRLEIELNRNSVESLAKTLIHSVKELVADALETSLVKGDQKNQVVDHEAYELTAKAIVRILNEAKNPKDSIIGFDVNQGRLIVNDHPTFAAKANLLYIAKRKLLEIKRTRALIQK